MKKVIALFLVLSLLFSLISCKNKKPVSNNSSKIDNAVSSAFDETNSNTSSQSDNTQIIGNPSSDSLANATTDNKKPNINKPDISTTQAENKLATVFNNATLTPLFTNDEQLDKLTKNLFKDILKNKPTTYEKVLACYEYIVMNATHETPLIFFGEEKYASECDYYIVEYAKNLLTNKKGGYEGFGSALTVLFRAIGLDAYLVGGTALDKDNTESPHAWCVVKIDNDEYIFDPLLEQTKSNNFFFPTTYKQAGSLYKADSESIFSANNFKNFALATCDTVGHKWKDATCITAKTCTVCGIVEGEKSEHTWSAKNCDDLKICSVCGEKSTEILGHDFAPATCLSPKKCNRCGITEGSITDHSYEEKLFDSTCTEEGRLYHICSICTTSYYETIAVKGHSYDEWVTTLKATTEADGEKKRTCKNCKAYETALISKLTTEQIQISILALINDERKKANLAPLEYYPLGQSAADKRADELLSSFSHTRPNGSKFYTVFGEYSIAYQSSAESIAKDLTTPEDVIKQLLLSPEDKKNILGDYKNIMLGYKNSNWVILFIDQ